MRFSTSVINEGAKILYFFNSKHYNCGVYNIFLKVSEVLLFDAVIDVLNNKLVHFNQ